MDMYEAILNQRLYSYFISFLDMEGNGGMINMGAPLKEFLCISLQNILDMDNLVDVYHNSFDTSHC